MQKIHLFSLLIPIILIATIGCLKIDSEHTRAINRSITFNLTQIPKKASILFYPNCSSEPLSNIHIRINNERIWNGLPDCNITMDFFHRHMPRYLNIGNNNINFYTEKGYYDIKDIRFSSQP